jgi:hypothetical protein
MSPVSKPKIICSICGAETTKIHEPKDCIKSLLLRVGSAETKIKVLENQIQQWKKQYSEIQVEANKIVKAEQNKFVKAKDLIHQLAEEYNMISDAYEDGYNRDNW